MNKLLPDGRLRGVMDEPDRLMLDGHYHAIAERLQTHRYWRHQWRIEINGCVYKFKMEGYAKKGSEIWKEQQAELASLPPDEA
jgi:hypothetical protein